MNASIRTRAAPARTEASSFPSDDKALLLLRGMEARAVTSTQATPRSLGKGTKSPSLEGEVSLGTENFQGTYPAGALSPLPIEPGIVGKTPQSAQSNSEGKNDHTTHSLAGIHSNGPVTTDRGSEDSYAKGPHPGGSTPPDTTPIDEPSEQPQKKNPRLPKPTALSLKDPTPLLRLSATSTIVHSPSVFSTSLAFLHKPKRSGSDSKEALHTLENTGVGPSPRLSSVSSLSSSSGSSLYSAMAAAASLENSLSESEDDRRRPHGLVRKKSGELVKPSLRERSSSLPATPTSKQVHFGISPDVRFFDRRDRPLAVSATNSPKLAALGRVSQGYWSDEGQFGSDGEEIDSDVDLSSESGSTDTLTPVGKPQAPGGATRWGLELPNFPSLSVDAKLQNADLFVFIERVFISADSHHLVGQVAVRNLAYHKWVSVRYTPDRWSTVIEVSAEYVSDVPRVMRRAGFERFMFRLPLVTLFNNKRREDPTPSPQTLSEKKFDCQTLEMCVRYATDGREFWDNNNGLNYAIGLRRSRKRTTPTAPVSSANGSVAEHRHYSSAYAHRRSSESDIGQNPSSTRAAVHSASLLMASPKTPEALNAPHLLGTPNFDDLAFDSENRDNHVTNFSLSHQPQRVAPILATASEQLSLSPKLDLNGVFPPISPVTLPLESKAYVDFLEKYCFFNGPSTVSSFLSDE